MADDFRTLPSGLRILSADPVGEGGIVLNENLKLLDHKVNGYIHQQTEPAAVWTIVHALHKPVAVTIVDSAGTVVIGDVMIVDLNTVEVGFSGGFAGKAYIV